MSDNFYAYGGAFDGYYGTDGGVGVGPGSSNPFGVDGAGTTIYTGPGINAPQSLFDR